MAVPCPRRQSPSPLPTTDDQDGPRRARVGGWRAGGGDPGPKGVWPLAGRRLDILGQVMDGGRAGVSASAPAGFPGTAFRGWCCVRYCCCCCCCCWCLLQLLLGFARPGGGLILGMKGEKIRPELHCGRSVPAKTFGQFLLGPSFRCSRCRSRGGPQFRLPRAGPHGKWGPQFHGLPGLVGFTSRLRRYLLTEVGMHRERRHPSNSSSATAVRW